MKIPFTNLSINLVSNDPKRKGALTDKGDKSSIGIFSNYGVRIAPNTLWQVYRLSADIFACIREWRQGVGNGGYRLTSARDREVEPKKDVVEFVEEFFYNSGGVQSISEKLLRDHGIAGNPFFEIIKSENKKPWGLGRLDPRSMYILADAGGEVLKYVQRVYGSKDITFEPDEVFHPILDYDPDNELLGFSPLETAMWEARTDISAAKSNYYFFENDAVPSVVYIAEPGTSPERQKEAIDNIRAHFGGAENRNKSGLLAGIKEIKTLSMSQKDMEFIVGRKFNTDKICSVFGVPKFILGYTESVNYSSGAKLLEKFYRGTIQPLERKVARAINTQLFKKIGVSDEVRIEFLPQTFGEELETTRLALEEYKSGALTLRQYKVKTGQEVTAEDENEEFIDKHIIHSGASAVLLEDVGVEPVVDPNDPISANNIVEAISNKFREYEE